MGILIQLAIYAAIAAAAWFAADKAWTGFKQGIAEPYVQAQVAQDAELVKAANLRATQANTRAAAREEENKTLAAAADAQSAAVKAAQDEAKRNADAARAQSQRYAALVAANAQRDAKLKAAALAAPKNQSCEATLAETDRILRESARISQGLSK